MSRKLFCTACNVSFALNPGPSSGENHQSSSESLLGTVVNNVDANGVAKAHDPSLKAHYQSLWHKYNLKRKVAGLPPLTEAEFDRRSRLLAERKRKQQEKEKNEKELRDRRDQGFGRGKKGITVQQEGSYTSQQNNGLLATPPRVSPSKAFGCKLCKKMFGSKGQLISHLQSKKHRKAVLELEKKKKIPIVTCIPCENETVDEKKSNSTQMQTEGDNKEEEVDAADNREKKNKRIVLGINDCLFCSHKSNDIAENLVHMRSVHSFHLPDAEYLSDLPGIMSYLAAKVSVGMQCLFCNGRGKQFTSLSALQNHMRDKGHCRIRYDEEEDLTEYDQFYDFSESYISRGLQPPVQMDVEDGDNESSSSSSSSSDVSAATLERKRLSDLRKSKVVKLNEIGELVLPSGKVIGHRDYRRYYEQKPHAEIDYSPIFNDEQIRLGTLKSKRRTLIEKLITDYQSSGIKTSSALVEHRRAQAKVYRGKAKGQRSKDKRDLKMGTKNNKTTQKYFRRRDLVW